MIFDFVRRPVILDMFKKTRLTNEASGSPIMLTDSANSKVLDFNVYGRSTQTQYSGKNLLKNTTATQTVNGITFTVNEDKSVTVNGTATSNAYIALCSMTLASGDYILSGCPNGGGDNTYRLYFYIGNTLHSDKGAEKAFTLAEDTTFSPMIIVYSGQTVNNIKFYPMIRLASVTDSTYEPYTNGASPNPDYPQAIKSVGDMGYFDGELLQGLYNMNTGAFSSSGTYVCNKTPIPCDSGDSVKIIYEEETSGIVVIFYDEDMTYINSVYGQNISEFESTAPTNAKYFNFDIGATSTITPQTAKHICVTINDKYALIEKSVGKNLLDVVTTSYSHSGVALTVNDDKTITLNGTCVEGASYAVTLINNLKLYAGQYVLTGNPLQGHNYRISIKVNNVYYADDGNGVTFTVNETTYCEVFFIVNGGTTYNNVTYKPMIRPVGTDDTYEPYKESRKYIPISAPIRGLGEVTDVASLSECEVARKYTKVVFDGSSDEGWSLKTIGCELYLNNTNSGNALCTHYKKNNGVSWGDLQDNEFNIVGTVLRIKDDTHQSTLDEWKAHLQSNPITVIYELATPVTSILGAALVSGELETFNNVTQIVGTDNPDMWVQYYTDTAQTVANEINTLDTQLTNLQEQVSELAGRDLYLENWQHSDDVSSMGGLLPYVELPNGITNSDYVIVSCDYGFTSASGSNAEMYHVIDEGTDQKVTPIVRFDTKEIVTYIEDTLGQIDEGNKWVHLRVMLRKIVKG